MKTLYKIPFLIMLAAVIAMGLGYGYNCIADKPLEVKAIPLTPGQRTECDAVGINANDMQLARWGSETAKLRIQSQLVDEMSKRTRAAVAAMDRDAMDIIVKDTYAATGLFTKLTR